MVRGHSEWRGDGSFDRAAPVESRAHPALVPAFADKLLIVLTCGLLGLEIGQLQLFPQPIEHVFDFELEHELQIALTASRLSAFFFALLRLSRPQHLARLTGALSCARLAVSVAQSEARVLSEPHRHEDCPATRTAEHIRARDQVGQRFLDGLAYFLVVSQPIACAA
jgi:hypothetical protein